MKQFNNIRISTSLRIGFLLVALLVAIVGLVGILNLRQVKQANIMLYEDVTEPISNLSGLAIASQQIRTISAP